MPRGDRTGPDGMGPMTGRGMGYCAGYAAPGYMSGGYGMGRGRGGVGRGRGYRRMQTMPVQPMWEYAGYPAGQPYPAVDEKEALKHQADYLEKQLSAVRDRLDSLDKDA